MAGLSKDNQLRDVYSKKNIRDLSKRLLAVDSKFNKKGFDRFAIQNLDSLSFGERGKRICAALREYLPQEFEKAIKILTSALGPVLSEPGKTVWEAFIVLPQCAYVSQFGKQHFDLSMNALYEMTRRFSAEGDLRTFLEVDYKKCMDILRRWAADDCPHVRRLVSEGTRPRLPLAGRIKRFQEDPRPLLELLELLKEDESLYVRRSVANNLNDISKDHPELTIELLKRWSQSGHPGTAWIVKHASRTLLKQGNKKALSIFGYTQNPKLKVTLELRQKKVAIGKQLDFQVTIQSLGKKKQKVLIDYVVHFVKSNGTNSAKVFKWTSREIASGEVLQLKRKQHMRQTSVRKLYPGRHFLEIQVNGDLSAKTQYDLK